MTHDLLAALDEWSKFFESANESATGASDVFIPDGKLCAALSRMNSVVARACRLSNTYPGGRKKPTRRKKRNGNT